MKEVVLRVTESRSGEEWVAGRVDSGHRIENMRHSFKRNRLKFQDRLLFW